MGGNCSAQVSVEKRNGADNGSSPEANPDDKMIRDLRNALHRDSLIDRIGNLIRGKQS